MNRLVLPWTTVYADTNTYVDLPALDWMRVGNIGLMRVVWEIAGITNSTNTLTIMPGLEHADVENAVQGSAVDIYGTAKSADGRYYPASYQSVAATLAGARLWRPIWRCKLDVASGRELARVGGVIETLPRE